MLSPFIANPFTSGASNTQIGSSAPSSAPSSAQNANTDNSWYSFIEYLKGLMSSVGAENMTDRKFNAEQAALQREWASNEAALNRQWQEQMRSSAFQDTVSDLRAAGINPILAATGGATSTPSGMVASGSSASNQSHGGDTMSSLITALANVAKGVGEMLPGLSDILKTKNKIGF